MRENAHEATYIQRTLEEFQELHNKLGGCSSLFPLAQVTALPALCTEGYVEGQLGAGQHSPWELRPASWFS